MHNNCCGCVMPKLLWMGYSQQSYIRLIWKKCILKLCYHDIEKNWNLDIMTTTISEGNFSDTYQFVGKMKVTSVWAEVLKKALVTSKSGNQQVRHRNQKPKSKSKSKKSEINFWESKSKKAKSIFGNRNQKPKSKSKKAKSIFGNRNRNQNRNRN